MVDIMLKMKTEPDLVVLVCVSSSFLNGRAIVVISVIFGNAYAEDWFKLSGVWYFEQ